MTADAVGLFGHPEGGYTSARGSMQFLPNNNAFVCWSGDTRLSEHTSDGKLIMKAIFKVEGANSYRSYKFPWVGKPSAPPDVHSKAIDLGKNNTSTLVHVSWNGATEVKTWNLYKTNPKGGAARLVASTLRQGFETALTCDGYAGYVIVEGLDVDGKVLGRSGIFKTIAPRDPMHPAVIKETAWLQEHSKDDPIANSDAPLSGGPSIFSNPIVQLLIGIVATVIAAFGLVLFWRARRERVSWWRTKTPKYGAISEADEEKNEMGEETLVEDDADEKTGMIKVREDADR